MIALLFLLMLVAMVGLLLDKMRLSYSFFVISLMLSVYWFHFHATSKLTVIW